MNSGIKASNATPEYETFTMPENDNNLSGNYSIEYLLMKQQQEISL